MRAIAELEHRLLPRHVPELPGWRIAVFYGDGSRPGGDYYDFLPLPDGELGLLVTDASGHGGPAAVMVAQVRTLLHSCLWSGGRAPETRCPLGLRTIPPPRILLGALDRILEENSLPDQFLTAFYGVLSPCSKALRYANAGHPPPRWWRASTSTVEPLPDIGGPPLGIGLTPGYAEAVITLSPGDVLTCYSDGLTEAWNELGQAFGLDRLDAALRESAAQGAEVVKCHMLTLFDQFLAGRRPHDDVTVLALERTG
jgi:sigma-B regulation protein RsbU (phosphoserine phosphatase)